MAVIVYGINISRNGPLWDGRAAEAARASVDEMEQVIAEVGVHKVRKVFSHYVRQPTGHYESMLTARKDSGDWRVTDQGIVYGRWLAGLSTRNLNSSFKGYPHWVFAAQELHEESADIAEFVFERYLARMR